MVKIADLMSAMEKIAPAVLAESWDAIGLQIGAAETPVHSVLLTLDVTPEALQQAKQVRADLIITHHPLIFSPLRGVRSDQPEQQLVADLLVHKRACLAAHTNLDAAQGGVADALAASLGLLGAIWEIVIPTEAVGMETRCGHGRMTELVAPIRLGDLKRLVLQQLQGSGCLVNTGADREIRRLAVFPGSFDEDWLPALEKRSVEAIITGECKHHVGLMLRHRGISVLQAGHDITERVILQPLAARLQREFVQISFAVHAGIDYNEMAF